MNDEIEHAVAHEGNLIAEYIRIVQPCGVVDETAYCFSTLRVVHILSGSADWRIGRKVYAVREGDVVLLNNFEVRTILGCHGPEPLVMEVYAFPCAAVQHELECLHIFFCRTRAFENVLPMEEDVRRALEALRREIIAPAPSPALLRALLVCLTIALRRVVFRHNPEALTPSWDQSASIASIIAGAAAYIHNHPDEALTVDALAKRFGLSKSIFSKSFRRYMDIGVGEFVTQCRLERVIRLLRSSDVSILEAAFECGFQSSSGFYRAFKAATGTSPTVYLPRGAQAAR